MENFACHSTESHMAGNLMQCSLHRRKTKSTTTDCVPYCILKTDHPQVAKFVGYVQRHNIRPNLDLKFPNSLLKTDFDVTDRLCRCKCQTD